MKVYMVIEQSYPGYYIRRVFLDKDKAEQYAKIADRHPDTLSASQGKVVLEEQTISDFDKIEIKQFFKCRYMEIKKPNKKASAHFCGEVWIINDLDDDVSQKIDYAQYKCARCGTWENIITRTLKLQPVITQPDYNEEELDNKYRKICRDLMTLIKQHESRGWTEKMINEWLNRQH